MLINLPRVSQILSKCFFFFYSWLLVIYKALVVHMANKLTEIE